MSMRSFNRVDDSLSSGWQLNHCSMEFLHQKATCELIQHSLIDTRNHASAYALLVHIAEKKTITAFTPWCGQILSLPGEV